MEDAIFLDYIALVKNATQKLINYSQTKAHSMEPLSVQVCVRHSKCHKKYGIEKGGARYVVSPSEKILEAKFLNLRNGKMLIRVYFIYPETFKKMM